MYQIIPSFISLGYVLPGTVEPRASWLLELTPETEPWYHLSAVSIRKYYPVVIPQRVNIQLTVLNCAVLEKHINLNMHICFHLQ